MQHGNNIYKITNNITGFSYIGKTKRSLDRRWYEHCNYKSVQKNIHFYNAIRKYGKDCWTIEIIEEVKNVDLLDEREIFWIAHFNTFNNGYNSTTGGDGGYNFSKEARRNMSLNHADIRGSKNPNYGKEASIKCKSVVSKINKSRIWKKESRNKLIAANKGSNNPMFGTRFTWINDGVTRKRFTGDVIPEGFKEGFKL